MKQLIFSLIAGLTASLTAQANDFNCYDPIEELPAFTLTVMKTASGKLLYSINYEDSATIDDSYVPKSEKFKDWKRLAGYLPTIGDGIEGYNVTVLVNKYLHDPELVTKARFGLAEYRAAGPDGYYSISLKCDRFQREDEERD